MVMVGMAVCDDRGGEIVPSLHEKIPDRSIYPFWGSRAEAVRELRSRRRRRRKRRSKKKNEGTNKERKKEEQDEEGEEG